MHQSKPPLSNSDKQTHKCKYSYVEVGDMVLQQDLNIANTLLSAHKGEGDHSLCQQHKTTQNAHVNTGLKRD